MTYTNEQLTATLQSLIAGVTKMQNVIVAQQATMDSLQLQIHGLTSNVAVVGDMALDFSALDNIGNGSAKVETKPKQANKETTIRPASMDTLGDVVEHILARRKAGQTNENILNAWRKNPQHANEPRIYCDTVHNRKCKEYAKLNGIQLSDVSALLIEKLGSKWTLHKGI